MKRISVEALVMRLRVQPQPLVLDARRTGAFRDRPAGLPGAVPVYLDGPPQVPEVSPDTEIYVYCLCGGQASSSRVAMWLESAGFTNVSILEGGLPAWESAHGPRQVVDHRAGDAYRWRPIDPARVAGQAQQHIVERSIAATQSLPLKRDMAVLFVDMVDSTPLVLSESPEEVLRRVQAFMKIVVDVAIHHCGDVHDFQGDGAMLYFAGVGEAVPAAFNLRMALEEERRRDPTLPHARFAIDCGPLVMGYVGNPERSTLSFIGPCVNTAARLLRLGPVDAVVATQGVVDDARRSAPDLAAKFASLGVTFLKGFDRPVGLYCAVSDTLAPAPSDARTGAGRR